jgi:hypothetical protein
MKEHRMPHFDQGERQQHQRDVQYAEEQRQRSAREQEKRQSALTAEQERRRQERAAKVAKWNEEDRKEREEHGRRREADRLARVREEELRLKGQMRARFLATPGSTEADFERVWPDLLRRVHMEQTLTGSDLHEEYRRFARRVSGRPE